MIATSKGVNLQEKGPIQIDNEKQADAALESDKAEDVKQGIDWIASNRDGVSEKFVEHYKVGYLQALVASLNSKINYLQMDVDHLKADNNRTVELRDIGDQVQQIYDRVVQVPLGPLLICRYANSDIFIC